MSRLTSEQKLYLIERLAAFQSPAEIVRAAKVELKLDLTSQQVSLYDPGTVNGAKSLSQELKDYFEAARARFLDESLIPVVHRAYRLQRLQRLLDDPTFARNPKLVREVLEQAAKEIGGAFTNKREVSGPEGAPIVISQSYDDLRKLPADELARLHRDTLES